jgi:hypothetical protein
MRSSSDRPVSLVLLRDRDDEAEVRVHHQVLRRLVAALDALRERDLSSGREQLVATGLVEEELQRVRRRAHEVAVDVRRGRRVLPAAVVRHLETALLDLLVERCELLVVEIELLREPLELGHADATFVLTVRDQRSYCILNHLDRSIPDLIDTLTLRAGLLGGEPGYTLRPCQVSGGGSSS